MLLTEFPQVQALSVRQKLELVDEIWKSVSSEMDTLEVTSEEKNLLDSRWETFLKAPDNTLSIEELRRQLCEIRA